MLPIPNGAPARATNPGADKLTADSALPSAHSCRAIADPCTPPLCAKQSKSQPRGATSFVTERAGQVVFAGTESSLERAFEGSVEDQERALLD